jgi:hypothetical protein
VRRKAAGIGCELNLAAKGRAPSALAEKATTHVFIYLNRLNFPSQLRDKTSLPAHFLPEELLPKTD